MINALLAQMTDHIPSQATARGYAYFSLGALFDRADLKGGAYSVISQMTSQSPYGAFTSLDGAIRTRSATRFSPRRRLVRSTTPTEKTWANST